MTHEQLYSRLRADVLARHFALSRHTRADHFDQQAFLGKRKRAADDDHGASPGGITWTLPTDAKTRKRLYKDAADLRAKLKAGQLEAERWRWAKHDRTNSLIQAGMRMVSLAIDLRMGDMFALLVLERVVTGLDAMFHFKRGPSPFEGYMVRWDAVASDLWDTNGRKLVQNLEFLINGDPKTFSAGDHYLYCTPLDDSRYIDAVARHDGGQRGKDRYRRWEPSMDEYVGVLTGYFMIWHTVNEGNAAFRTTLAPRTVDRVDALLARVRTQVRRIGKYLKATGFCLVRPNRGFAFRGALDVNPAFEYPVARVCHRITGDAMSEFLPGPEATFENAVDMAGQGQALRELTVGLQVTAGMSLEAVMAQNGLIPSSPLSRDILQAILPLAAAATLTISPIRLLAAAQFQRHLDLCDPAEVRIPSGALHYVMNFVARNTPGALGEGSISVFLAAFPKMLAQSPSTDWVPMMALTALDDSSSIVRAAYLGWYEKLLALRTFDPFAGQDVPAAGFNPASEIDPGHLRRGFMIYTKAVRLLLHPQSAGGIANELETDLQAMKQTIEDPHDGQPLLGVHPQPGSPSTDQPNPPVDELHDSSYLGFGYMLPLSLCWLHGLRGGAPTFAELPTPTAATARHWPAPEVPGSVVRTSRTKNRGFPFPKDWIMRGELPAGAAAYPLFKNPPRRPLDEDLGPPPPPMPSAQFWVPDQGVETDGWPVLPLPPGPVVRRWRRAVPALPAHLEADGYHIVAAVTTDTIQKVDWTVQIVNGECVVEARFWRRSLNPLDLDIQPDRRFKVHIEVTWVRAPD